MLVTENTHRLFNAQANVVAIYPIQGLVTESVPDWLEEMIDFISDREDDYPLLQALPSLKHMINREEFPSEEEFLEKLQLGNDKGFFFYGEWEVRHYLNDFTFTSGPGYRRIIWTYHEDIDGGFNAIIEAAEADHERQRAKAGTE